MKKEPFKKYRLSRYASQILQQYRNYKACDYYFRTEKNGDKELIITGAFEPINIKSESWNGVAFKLNQHMADAARTFKMSRVW